MFALNKMQGQKFDIDKMGKTILIAFIIHLIALVLGAEPYALSTLGFGAFTTIFFNSIISKYGVKAPSERDVSVLLYWLAVGLGITDSELKGKTVEEVFAMILEKLSKLVGQKIESPSTV